MECLADIRNRVKELAKMFDDGSGICMVDSDGNGIVLDTCGDYVNIEVMTLYANLFADTNIGYINLADEITDEDDWFTIEDILEDAIARK